MSMVAVLCVALVTVTPEPEAVVLEFTAPTRCPPCQQIAPLVHRLEREGFPIRAIDVDTNPSAGAKHRLTAVPTFVLLIAGREVDRFEGKPSEGELRQMCERARLANVASENQRKRDAEATAEQHRPTKSTPQPAHKSRPESRPAKDDEPIFRAKNDGAASLPPITSADPLHVCPRIRVKDSQGVNFGTGTIIESRAGRSTLLTCGHIFRKLDDQSLIEVDVFNGTKHETFVGKAIQYDLEADVGLLWIPTAHPLPAASVGEMPQTPAVGQHVFSVGCSGGDPPTKLQHRVTALNRYLGPDNIECTGVPIQGRSGGGLFDTSGRLVGVCIAADQRDQRGLYAGLKPIHQLLEKSKLSHLLSPSETQPKSDLLAGANVATSPIEPEFDPEPTTDKAVLAASPFATSAESDKVATASELPLSIGNSIATKSDDKPGKADFPQESNDEAEVVCIIRPLKDPRAASRIVIINRASSKFLSQLNGELEQQAKPTTAVVRDTKLKPATSPIRPYRRTGTKSP